MNIFIWSAAIIILFVLLRARRYSQVKSIANRPYRYQSDVRRSKWSHTKGF